MELAGLILGAVGTGVSVLMLILFVARGLFSIEKRLTTLETQIEPFWEGVRQTIAKGLISGVSAPGNPMPQARWESLLQELNDGTLGTDDAFELNQAMLERQEEAVQQKDNAALITLGIGLALLAALFLKKKSEVER